MWTGEPPALFGAEPPKPRIEAARIVDMTASNAWAEFAAVFARTRAAHLEHEQAKAELKSVVPEDAKEAIGYGIRAKRSRSGAISFDLISAEPSHAALQSPATSNCTADLVDEHEFYDRSGCADYRSSTSSRSMADWAS